MFAPAVTSCGGAHRRGAHVNAPVPPGPIGYEEARHSELVLRLLLSVCVCLSVCVSEWVSVCVTAAATHNLQHNASCPPHRPAPAVSERITRPDQPPHPPVSGAGRGRVRVFDLRLGLREDPPPPLSPWSELNVLCCCFPLISGGREDNVLQCSWRFEGLDLLLCSWVEVQTQEPAACSLHFGELVWVHSLRLLWWPRMCLNTD